jgi:dCTP deaminase
MIRTEIIAHLLARGQNIEASEEEGQPKDDPLVISPLPDLDKLRRSGSASIDLRLGTWFVTLRGTRMTHLQPSGRMPELQLTKSQYVPFGSRYLLHPQSFVLGITLEWMRIPKNYGGYVTAKSSWGRRGLIIATATGVHPGFKGCLTLELTNVGEIPIAIQPGMTICQLFLHTADASGSDDVDGSRFAGSRRPALGQIEPDEMALKLANAYENTKRTTN